ncbi:ABC transporter substrate-binding protein [Herbiconiux sp. KACC 21604]|uniref:ABC transporter substrate-binding protein n=1 Tax=unclassified Herbiconiux TaxID=2618217 RepID=UPI0014912438|nr:ABC transporter substrate-binding protein [Herbiconiux sp. SALV-R1]QJU52719.1 ABC transporter substrate-binding protein [Herbiconiux sp. SALV-R1]WPO87620.1 ABC transporter substrate-binding protein [Herbiconiux sp. KACC 21604]
MRFTKHLSVVGVAAAALALAACSGVGGATDGSGGSEPVSTSAATGTPIKVGFLNQGSGALAFPDFGTGGTVGIEQVNADGGIKGQPIDLVVCNVDGTPAASVKCANQFVDDGVVAVIQGIDLSSDTALEILAGAGIPFIGHTPFGAAQTNSPNAWFFGAAPGAFYGVPLKTLKDEFGVKTVAFLNPDSPVTRSVADASLDPAAEALGVTVTKNFYNPTSPNYTAAFASAVADDPDAVFMIAPEPDCTAFVQAARTLGYQGEIFAGSCGQFVTADPAAAEGVLSDSDLYVPDDTSSIPAEAGEQIASYRKAVEGQPAANVTNFTQMTYSTMQDFATVARSIDGEVTPESLTTALKAVSGVDSFMGQPLTCDGEQWPDSISICAPGLLVYSVEGGTLKPVSGEFVDIATLYEN